MVHFGVYIRAQTLYYLASLYPTSFSLTFVPSARVLVGVSHRALWRVGDFSCDCTFWGERGGEITRQPVGPLMDIATMKRKLGSQCCPFRRTSTSAEPIRLHGIRLALSLTLSLPSGFTPSPRPMVCVSPCAL